MQKLKVSLIGAGHAGVNFHLPGLSTFDDIDLSICDLNRELLDAAGDRFGILMPKRYTDYREMFRREDPSAVLVLMAQYPTHMENDQCQVVTSTRSREAYFQIVNDVLRQKRNLMVEKPLAMTPAEALPLVEAAEKAGVVTMVSENRRFNVLVQHCRKRVLERGPMLNVCCHFYKGEAARWKVRMKNGTEVWLDDSMTDWLTGDMMHALYLMRYLGGGDIVDFSSSLGGIAGDARPTAFFALARFANGCTGQFAANVRAGARREVWEMHGIGISAYLETVPGQKEVRSMKASLFIDGDSANPEVIVDRELAGGKDWRHCAGFTGADRYFIDCVKAGRQPHCNFADAYKTLVYCKKILDGNYMTPSSSPPPSNF